MNRIFWYGTLAMLSLLVAAVVYPPWEPEIERASMFLLLVLMWYFMFAALRDDANARMADLREELLEKMPEMPGAIRPQLAQHGEQILKLYERMHRTEKLLNGVQQQAQEAHARLNDDDAANRIEFLTNHLQVLDRRVTELETDDGPDEWGHDLVNRIDEVQRGIDGLEQRVEELEIRDTEDEDASGPENEFDER